MRGLRRVKYRHLLRIGARDLLGDADLTVTTAELAHLADACLAEAVAFAEAAARVAYGAARDATGAETGVAIVAMGKLGGEELNYSADIDLMCADGADGGPAGGRRGRVPNGEYFARVCRGVVAFLEEVTDEGYAFRVDLRLRPEGRMGAVVLSLDRYRDYYRDRAELWERQALIKARVAAGDLRVGARFMELAREAVYRPGLDARIVPAIRAMKAQIDRTLVEAGRTATNVKLGRGGGPGNEVLLPGPPLLYGGAGARRRASDTPRGRLPAASGFTRGWSEAGRLRGWPEQGATRLRSASAFTPGWSEAGRLRGWPEQGATRLRSASAFTPGWSEAGRLRGWPEQGATWSR